MLRYLFFISLILGQFMVAQSQAVHYFHCVEVMEGDEVILTWEVPGNQADFESYQIYSRVPPAGFSPIDTITNYSTSTYTDITTEAKQKSVEYYILTNRLSTTNDSSHTLSTIHLTVDNGNPNLAVLDWNAIHTPLLPGSYDHYRVYMQNPQTNLTLVDSTTATHFEIPLEVCRDTLFFKVEIGNANGCLSVSNTTSAVFADITPPPMPTLDSVSINPFTEETILGWTQSVADDAGGYQIYIVDDINDTIEPPIYGINNTFYIDDSFDPCLELRAYAIATFDTCSNISPGSYDLPQRTILFSEVVFDPCEMSNLLNWTEYINMSPTLEGYRVYLSIDGGTFTLLSTLPAGTISFLHEGLIPGTNYKYFIRAFSQGDLVTSSSCFRELTTWQYLQPTSNELANTSVENASMVTLTLWPETYAYVTTLLVYRSEDPFGSYQLLVELDLAGQSEIYYDDMTADVDNVSYYYMTAIIDSCGNEVLLTDPFRTILLSGEREGDLNHLTWNAFEGWTTGIDAYEVYRATELNGAFDLIGSVDDMTLSFDDNISSLGGDFSLLQYMVRAHEAGGNGFYSQSNVLSFEYEPTLYLPNAFAPNGQNNVYQPVGSFTEFSEYRLDVYNRWGQLIFTSHDFDLGWDGGYNGGDAPTGVYVCTISYRSHAGENTTIQSTFVLIR